MNEPEVLPEGFTTVVVSSYERCLSTVPVLPQVLWGQVHQKCQWYAYNTEQISQILYTNKSRR